MIRIIAETTITHPQHNTPVCRTANITITNGGVSYAWDVGGLPLEGDLQTILDACFDEILAAASTAGILAPEYQDFELPIKTPALYADDVFVSSRDIKDDPEEALAEAVAETQKAKGEPKSLDLISRSTLIALKQAMKEIKKLRLDVDQLKKKVK